MSQDMFFSINRLRQRTNEIRVKRYVHLQCIAPFVSMPGTLSEDEVYHELPEKIAGEPYGMKDFFIGRDKYLWLEKTVQFPEPKEGYEVVGLFDFGDTGVAATFGFESLLYVDDQPYQGVDTFHREVVFQGLGGKEVNLKFLLWTGLEGGGGVPFDRYHQCKQADIGYLYKKADELYYYAEALTSALEYYTKRYNKVHENFYDWQRVLEKAFRCIDWNGPDFYETIETAHAVLMEELSKLNKNCDVTIHAVGHSHIDVTWLWRLKHTREKIQRTFSTVLHLMDMYDEYIFLQSQPQLYKFIKEDCPELYEKIKARIAEGRWEPEGGMWVESDCNVVSGESLVRQILYGTRFMEREFGTKCEYLWLPDVFGYNWALPQILKQCEINTFTTTKISWNDVNFLKDDLFIWRGIDGTEIMTYFIDIPLYNNGIPRMNYNSLLNIHDVVGSTLEFKNKELTKDILMCFGNGDGGGGVTRSMLEMGRTISELPGLPTIKITKAGEYFRMLHDQIENSQVYVHTWDNELYLECHRGVYTTHGDMKKSNRRMENKMTQIEWLSSLDYLVNGNYALEEMNEVWESILLNQFHDTLPGSSLHEVYDDCHLIYDKAESKADKVKENVLAAIVKADDSSDVRVYSIYSHNSFGGKELVQIPEAETGYFVDEKGSVLAAQKCEGGYLVTVDVEPLAIVKVTFVPVQTGAEMCAVACENDGQAPFVISANGIETPFYSIQWNEDGQLSKIYDKEAKRQVLRKGQCGNVLEFYDDTVDAWEVCINYVDKVETAKLVAAPLVIENSSLRAIIRFEYRYHSSELTQDMIVYKDFRQIDFKTHVDWKETGKLLKAAFYTDIRSTRATYDIQFGHMERPTHWSNSWEWAKFEVCAQKWADLSDYSYGVSLLNDCKYGHNVKDNAIKISLLKSILMPDAKADRGEHEFTYSLLPHIGSFQEGGTIEAANRLNLPAQVVRGQFADDRRIVKVSANDVQIDVVKKAEDEECLVVRLHECKGGMSQVTLSSEFPVKRIVPCNMLEHDCGDAVEGNAVEFVVKPFEIKSYKLYM